MKEMENQQKLQRARSQELDKNIKTGFLRKQKSLVTEIRQNRKKPLELDANNIGPGCCVFQSDLLIKHF